MSDTILSSPSSISPFSSARVPQMAPEATKAEASYPARRGPLLVDDGLIHGRGPHLRPRRRARYAYGESGNRQATEDQRDPDADHSATHGRGPHRPTWHHRNPSGRGRNSLPRIPPWPTMTPTPFLGSLRRLVPMVLDYGSAPQGVACPRRTSALLTVQLPAGNVAARVWSGRSSGQSFGLRPGPQSRSACKCSHTGLSATGSSKAIVTYSVRPERRLSQQ